MVGRNSFQVITYVLLIALCFLQSLCKEEKPTDSVEIIEISNSGTDEPVLISKEVNDGIIKPGLGLGKNEDDKTSVLADSFKVSLEEKSVEIEQQDLGKTKEVKDDAEKADDKKAEHENETNGEDKQKDGKEEGKTEEEEKVEEKGIDLKDLNDNDFEHLTQAATGATTGDWLVLFTKKGDCDACTQAEKEMKIVYERVKHKLNVAKVVNGRSSKMTFKRFGIDELPVIFLFHHGKRFSYENKIAVDDFIKFLEGGYQLASWSAVRNPYTSFEYYVDETLEELKHMFRYKKNVSLVIFLTGFICGISVTSLCGSVLFHLLENFKDDEEVYLREQEVSRDLAAGKNKAD